MKYTQHLLGLTIVLILDLTLGLGGSCRLLLHLLLPPGPRPPGCPSRPLGSCCCCWQPLPRDEGWRPRHPGPTSALSSHQAQLFSSLFRFILYCSYWITMWHCSEEWTTCFWRFSLNSIHNINFKYVVFCSRLCDLNLKQYRYQCCGSQVCFWKPRRTKCHLKKYLLRWVTDLWIYILNLTSFAPFLFWIRIRIWNPDLMRIRIHSTEQYGNFSRQNIQGIFL